MSGVENFLVGQDIERGLDPYQKHQRQAPPCWLLKPVANDVDSANLDVDIANFKP
jgi:hypothetical protein